MSYADVSKSKEELGWVASRSLLEMCTDLWKWQKMNPFGYKETGGGKGDDSKSFSARKDSALEQQLQHPDVATA
jgi:hypothetical protein